MLAGYVTCVTREECTELGAAPLKKTGADPLLFPSFRWWGLGEPAIKLNRYAPLFRLLFLVQPSRDDLESVPNLFPDLVEIEGEGARGVRVGALAI